MAEQKQRVLPDGEKEEQELEDAETSFRAGDKVVATKTAEEFKEELGSDIVDVEVEEPSKEEIAKEYQDILIALGFTRYDNKEKGIACKLKVGHLLLGRTFTEQHPIGNMWVSCTADCEFGKKGEFLKTDQCKQIPQVSLFYRIRNGELAIPEPTITGKVIGKSAKAVQIQFDEFGKTDTQWWGLGALKKDKEGVDYVPASYSKETEKYTPKMQVPRDIILLNYDEELKAAPLVTQTETAEKKEEPGEEEKAQSTAKGTLGNVVAAKEPESEGKTPAHAEGEKPTVDYYINLIAEITEKVGAEGRISDRERGYAISKVFDAVTRDSRTALIADLKGEMKLSQTEIEAIAKAVLNADISSIGKGGDHEE